MELMSATVSGARSPREEEGTGMWEMWDPKDICLKNRQSMLMCFKTCEIWHRSGRSSSRSLCPALQPESLSFSCGFSCVPWMSSDGREGERQERGSVYIRTGRQARGGHGRQGSAFVTLAGNMFYYLSERGCVEEWPPALALCFADSS